MSKLVWDQVGERIYETGVSKGVLYPMSNSGTYPNGVAWNGLTSVSESPEGADIEDVYADNIKYLQLQAAETFGATIEAYTYPDEFALCDGSVELAPGVMAGQQPRKAFGLCYRTEVGNDIQGESYGYKLHLIYGGRAQPSEKSYETINDSPEAIQFSWEISTTPVNVTGQKATASITIDSTKIGDANIMTALEDILYGTDETITYVQFTGNSFESGVTYYELVNGSYVVTEDSTKQSGKTYYTASSTGGTAPRLPLPDEIIAIIEAASDVSV